MAASRKSTPRRPGTRMTRKDDRIRLRRGSHGRKGIFTDKVLFRSTKRNLIRALSAASVFDG
jgi:hypothetical protein